MTINAANKHQTGFWSTGAMLWLREMLGASARNGQQCENRCAPSEYCGQEWLWARFSTLQTVAAFAKSHVPQNSRWARRRKVASSRLRHVRHLNAARGAAPAAWLLPRDLRPFGTGLFRCDMGRRTHSPRTCHWKLLALANQEHSRPRDKIEEPVGPWFSIVLEDSASVSIPPRVDRPVFPG